MGKPNFYEPETWKELSQATQAKLAVMKSWLDGTNNDYEEIDWEGDF
jgi:hypothetical protein